jgi:hypothetical protein
VTETTGVTRSDGPAVPWVRELVGALLVYLMLTFIFTFSAWQDPARRWIGHCCDQQQFMWFLSWPLTALELGQNPLLTDRLNAPDGANLMWNAAMPLHGLLLSPLTRALEPILVYNLAALLGITLGGVAAYAALRRYTVRPLGALVGGALYAFSPFVASHTALHLNLINVWGPPLFLIILDELAARRRYRPELLGVLLGVVGAIQLLTFEEVLATSALAGLVLVIVLALVVRRRTALVESTTRLLRAVIPGVAAFLLLAGFPLAVQFFGPQQIHGQVQPPSVFSTDLLNIVVPTPYTLLAPDAATAISEEFSGLYHEATGYIGIPMLLVLGWIVVERRRDARVVVAAAVGLVMLVFSLGPQLFIWTEEKKVFMPWEPIADLPLIEHALPGRLTLYTYLAIAGIVAIGIDHALGLRLRAAGLRLVPIGIALVFLLPAPATSSTHDVPAFFRNWDRHGIARDDVILFAPWFTNGAGADPMLWAAVAESRPRMYEGYVYVPDERGQPRYGPEPGELAELMIQVQDHGIQSPLDDDQRAGAIRELLDAQVSVVIVGPLRYRAEMLALFTDLFRSPPVEIDGVALWRDVQGMIVGT